MSHDPMPRLSRIAIAATASAALIGTAILAPATSFAAPAAAPAVAAQASNAAAQPAAPVVYNGLSPQTGAWSSPLTNGGTLNHLGVLRVNGTDITNRAGTKLPDSIDPNGIKAVSTIDPTAVQSFEYVDSFTNNSSAPLQFTQSVALPKLFAAGFGTAYSPVTSDAGFDQATGLKASQMTGAPSDLTLQYGVANQVRQNWADYVAAGHTVQDLIEIQLTGTLAAGATMTVTVPLQVPDATVATNSFTYADWSFSAAEPVTIQSHARFTEPQKDPNGKNLIPYTGKFLATVAETVDGKTVAKALPDSLQALMPDATNGTNYWVDNHVQPAVNNPTTESVIYPASAQEPAGYYTIDAAPVASALKTHGYATELASDGTALKAYQRQAGVNVPTILAADGSPYQTTADHTAPWVGVRQVIAGNDTTISQNSAFDPKTDEGLALQVFGHDGKNVDLSSPDVTIDSSAVDTSTPGSYPITVTYGPDSVSNTFTVTVVAAAVTPSPSPSASATAPEQGAGSGAEVKTSGVGGAVDLAGLGVALAAAGAGTAAAVRRARRSRR